MDLEEVALRVVKDACRLGADQADALVIKVEEKNVSGLNLRSGVKKRKVTCKESLGLNLRTLINGSIGYSYTTDLSRNGLKEAVLKAIESARVKSAKLSSLTPPSKPSLVEGIFDNSMREVDYSDLIERIRSMNAEILIKTSKVSMVRAGFSLKIIEKHFANSLGNEHEYRQTKGLCFLSVKAESKGVASTFQEELESRSLRELKVEELREKVIEYAKLGLVEVKVEKGVKDVVFSQRAFSNIMLNLLVPAINGYNVLDGKSYLAGKIGEEVASKELTIIDDGLMRNGLYSSPIDDEGTPCRKTVIINEGVLTNYLRDRLTAERMGLESTGNTYRGLTKPVTIGPRNQVIEGGEMDWSELISEGETLLIESIMGAHSSNPASGKFSISSPITYVAKKGELIGSVRNTLISGSMQDLLMKFKGQSRDKRQVDFLYSGYIKSTGLSVLV